MTGSSIIGVFFFPSLLRKRFLFFIRTCKSLKTLSEPSFQGLVLHHLANEKKEEGFLLMMHVLAFNLPGALSDVPLPQCTTGRTQFSDITILQSAARVGSMSFGEIFFVPIKFLGSTLKKPMILCPCHITITQSGSQSRVLFLFAVPCEVKGHIFKGR